MKHSSDQPGKLSNRALVAVTLLAIVGTSIHSLGQSLNRPPRPASSRADEALEGRNNIGNKLVAMAQDFPEDKYDYKLQKRPAHSCRQSSARRGSRLRSDAL
jgi:hypothetical protein